MRTRNIIVTGAFGGIGRAVSRELERCGHRITRVGRHAPEGLREGGSCAHSIAEADLSTPAGWERAIEAGTSEGRDVDLLVHAAGALVARDFLSTTPDELSGLLGDNLLSVMLGFRALLPGMLERRRGHIIVIGSLGGVVPMPHGAVYSATKFGVRGFVLSMAEELRETGVHASLVSCGPVDTAMLRREAGVEGTIVFVNRPIRPMDVADAVTRLIDHPRRESFVPRSQALLPPLVGAYSRMFQAAYPAISAAGSSGKRRYAETIYRTPLPSGE